MGFTLYPYPLFYLQINPSFYYDTVRISDFNRVHKVYADFFLCAINATQKDTGPGDIDERSLIHNPKIFLSPLQEEDEVSGKSIGGIIATVVDTYKNVEKVLIPYRHSLVIVHVNDKVIEYFSNDEKKRLDVFQDIVHGINLESTGFFPDPEVKNIIPRINEGGMNYGKNSYSRGKYRQYRLRPIGSDWYSDPITFPCYHVLLLTLFHVFGNVTEIRYFLMGYKVNENQRRITNLDFIDLDRLVEIFQPLLILTTLQMLDVMMGSPKMVKRIEQGVDVVNEPPFVGLNNCCKTCTEQLGSFQNNFALPTKKLLEDVELNPAKFSRIDMYEIVLRSVFHHNKSKTDSLNLLPLCVSSNLTHLKGRLSRSSKDDTKYSLFPNDFKWDGDIPIGFLVQNEKNDHICSMVLSTETASNNVRKLRIIIYDSLLIDDSSSENFITPNENEKGISKKSSKCDLETKYYRKLIDNGIIPFMNEILCNEQEEINYSLKFSPSFLFQCSENDFTCGMNSVMCLLLLMVGEDPTKGSSGILRTFNSYTEYHKSVSILLYKVIFDYVFSLSATDVLEQEKLDKNFGAAYLFINVQFEKIKKGFCDNTWFCDKITSLIMNSLSFPNLPKVDGKVF